MRQVTCLLLLLTASSVWIGCGGPARLDGVIAATGVVTYQGQPVADATVVFAPQGPGRAACGRTDAHGRFQLTTLVSGDGLMPGKYQVTVSKTEVAGAMTEEESQAYFQKHGKPPKVTTKETLPAKYKTAATSGLTAEVTSGGKNDFTLDLVD